MRSRLFIAAFWSPAGKGLSQVCYLIVSIPDLYRLSYLENTPACCEVYVSYTSQHAGVFFKVRKAQRSGIDTHPHAVKNTPACCEEYVS